MGRRKTRFIVGTSGWSYDHWKGSFYPEDRPKSRWFEYYAERFSTVEVNATFYRSFRDQTYLKWREKAPEGFLYVLKTPRLITHRRVLKDVHESIRIFCKSAALLEDRLGVILLQLAPGMPHDPDRLKKALLAFDDPRKVAVEFRHKRWLNDETKSLLEELGAIFCTADSPKTGLLDWVTSDAAYIRLHGRKRWYAYDYSDQELEEIAALAGKMKKRGAKDIYIYFNNDMNASAARNALALIEILKKEFSDHPHEDLHSG